MPGQKRKFSRSKKTSKPSSFKRFRKMSSFARPKYTKPRLTANSMYRYSRYADVEQLLPGSGQEYDYAPTFSLDKVRTYSDFTSLYDKFKITGVQVTVHRGK